MVKKTTYLQRAVKRNRRELVRGAKGHIKSINVALARYAKGSGSEKGYALEHAKRLINYYLDKM